MPNNSPWLVAGWGWAMDSKHSPFCQTGLTYLDRSNLWLLGRFWWHFTYNPLFFQLKHKTEELVASRLLRLLLCWISKGSNILALQKHNIPRSGLYIMSRYEKTVGGIGGPWNKHLLTTSTHWIHHDCVTQAPPLLYEKTHRASITEITEHRELDSHPLNSEANLQSAGLSLFVAYADGEMMPLISGP